MPHPVSEAVYLGFLLLTVGFIAGCGHRLFQHVRRSELRGMMRGHPVVGQPLSTPSSPSTWCSPSSASLGGSPAPAAPRVTSAASRVSRQLGMNQPTKTTIRGLSPQHGFGQGRKDQGERGRG